MTYFCADGIHMGWPVMRFYPHFSDQPLLMIPEKSFAPKRLLLLASFFVFSFINIDAQDGKALFVAKCASCHIMGGNSTGPDLQGVVERWGGDEGHVKQWILNYDKLVKSGDAKAVEVASST